MRSVSTTEILARKALGRACGQECVDWAIGMLERGLESKSLLVLAGMVPPLNHFELADLRDRALEETPPSEPPTEDPITAFVAETVADGLRDERPMPEVFAEIAQLAIELGYPGELEPFYLLRFAWKDLQQSDMQWYWQGATRENIDRIMRDEAERFATKAPSNSA